MSKLLEELLARAVELEAAAETKTFDDDFTEVDALAEQVEELAAELTELKAMLPPSVHDVALLATGPAYDPDTDADLADLLAVSSEPGVDPVADADAEGTELVLDGDFDAFDDGDDDDDELVDGDDDELVDDDDDDDELVDAPKSYDFVDDDEFEAVDALPVQLDEMELLMARRASLSA